MTLEIEEGPNRRLPDLVVGEEDEGLGVSGEIPAEVLRALPPRRIVKK